MNLKEEAKRIAKEALDESDCFVHARWLVEIACENHKVAHCEASAMRMCIDQAADDAVDYLYAYEGGVALPGYTLGDIVCRVAKHTLLFAAFECLNELFLMK